MSAPVIPFPKTRDRPYVERHARRIAARSAEAGERYLLERLNERHAYLSRRQVAPSLIAQDVAALEAAIRAELWRVVLAPGGVA